MPRALITGPTAGIGLAFAQALATEGYDLVLVSRDKARLEQLAADLTERHDVACEALPADLTDLAQTRAVEEWMAGHPIDVLVNNAGFGKKLPFEAADVDDEQDGLDVMVRAVLRLTHAALRPMLARNRGDIVNVSSVAGFVPRGSYGAHKAWVTSFSRWANLRYRGRGVRVMALCPGFVRTEFHQRMGVDHSRIPTFLWLQPETVVREALRDLRAGKAVSVPSKRWKVIMAAARLAPAGLAERVARWRR